VRKCTNLLWSDLAAETVLKLVSDEEIKELRQRVAHLEARRQQKKQRRPL
jgi:hypothetical protein